MNTATTQRVQKASTHESGTRKILSLPNGVVNSLLRCLDLRDGWSSYKAARPAVEAVSNGMELLQRWNAPVLAKGVELEIAPALDGGLDLTFDLNDKWVSVLLKNDRAIEIERSDDVEVTVNDPSLVDEHLYWLVESR